MEGRSAVSRVCTVARNLSFRLQRGEFYSLICYGVCTFQIRSFTRATLRAHVCMCLSECTLKELCLSLHCKYLVITKKKSIITLSLPVRCSWVVDRLYIEQTTTMCNYHGPLKIFLDPIQKEVSVLYLREVMN